jgi:predicted AlkP superfamily pyrophosphatase or phosphodiesterase
MQKPGSFLLRQVMIATVLIFVATESAYAAPVLMISVDGLKPEYVLQADARGLRIPYLRSVVSEGIYADGVIGVWPTNTYPSHTTLVTGVSPAEHGIFTNLEFDPEHRFKESWFWYAQQIRVPTLWQAVHRAGLVTASVGWPATVGAADIDFLIPEYWRNTGTSEDLNPSERNLIAAVSRPDDLLAQMQDSVGAYMMGNDTSLKGDEIKTRFSIEIMRLHKPTFMSIHLSSLDAAEHAYGVFSAQANEDLEAIDAMLSRLAAAARANNPTVIVVIVSDHGFTPITHKVNLYVPFLQAGLIETAQNPEAKALKIVSWRAQPWLASGMAAIMLKDPGDRHVEQDVGELLQKLAADPNNGIASIHGRTEIKQLGGFPDAAFIVALKPGFYAGDNLTGDVVTDIHGTHGGHGFSPEVAEMRAAFFVSGAGVARHRDLGVIDMRQIAPTVAQLLGVSLPTAKAVPLHVVP